MNKLRKYWIYGLGLLVVSLGVLRASPEQIKNAGHPHDMEKIAIRDDVTLDLSIPYSKVLFDEFPHIYLGIKNEGDTPNPSFTVDRKR